MAVTRVNSSSISASGTTASAFSVAIGVACSIDDLIVVTACCNGTHVSNGMSVVESTNAQTFGTLDQVQLGGAGARWMQTFLLVTVSALTGTENITLTPYAANTQATFVVDVFRGITGAGSPVLDFQSASGASGTSATSPDLLFTPYTPGDLVMSLTAVSSGTATQPSPYLLGSQRTTGPTTSNAYILATDGSSTYGGAWTWGTTNTSALTTVLFSGSGLSSPGVWYFAREVILS